VIPKLSATSWALLGVLHRASHGGPRAPAGFLEEYAELRARNFVDDSNPPAITEAGEAALQEYFLPD
jgi:hypothetical protein